MKITLSQEKKLMNNEIHAILISRDSELKIRLKMICKGFFSSIKPIILSNEMDHSSLSGKNKVFLIDLRSDSEAGLTLAHKLKRSKAKPVVITLYDEKDPKLLLKSLRYEIDDYLDLSEPDISLRESISITISRRYMGKKAGEIIGIFSLKGGQGITTLAINITDHITRLSRDRVLLFDMHIDYSHVANYLDQPIDYTPFQLLADLGRMDDVLLFSSITEHINGWHILAVPPSEISVADVITGEDIKELLDFLKKHYRYIILDLPHQVSVNHAKALQFCDRLLLPFRQDVQSIRALQTVIKFLREIGFPEQSIHPLLNARTNKSPIKEEDVKHLLDIPISYTVDDGQSRFSLAQEKRIPIYKIDPNCRENRQLQEIAASLVNLKLPNNQPSIIKKLFGK